MDLHKVISQSSEFISQSSELWFLILDGQPTLTGVLIHVSLATIGQPG